MINSNAITVNTSTCMYYSQYLCTAQRGCIDLVNDKLFLVNIINLIVVLLYFDTFLKMLVSPLYHHQKRLVWVRAYVCMWCLPALSTTTRHSLPFSRGGWRPWERKMVLLKTYAYACYIHVRCCHRLRLTEIMYRTCRVFRSYGREEDGRITCETHNNANVTAFALFGA